MSLPLGIIITGSSNTALIFKTSSESKLVASLNNKRVNEKMRGWGQLVDSWFSGAQIISSHELMVLIYSRRLIYQSVSLYLIIFITITFSRTLPHPD